MSVSDVLALRLKLRESNPEWTIWEHKTFNIHRGVLQWRPPKDCLSFREMTEIVKQQLSGAYRIAWWRGFAFGVLIESAAMPSDLAIIDSTIDIRANSAGTWQWTIFTCAAMQTALGVHTWKEGYLSETYRGLLRQFEARGYLVGSFKKEKDKLMQFLTVVAGLKGVNFSEFQP